MFKDNLQLPKLLKEAIIQRLYFEEAVHLIYPEFDLKDRIIPEYVRLSAVLGLLFIKNNEWHILVIKRTEDGHAHSGQISFPGGAYENDDDNLLSTALRETYEEIGIKSEDLTPLGRLSSVYIQVSNFKVIPYIAHINYPFNTKLNFKEVERIIEIPLSKLTEDNITNLIIPIKNNSEKYRKVNAYRVSEHDIIWGATAIMITELGLIIKNLKY